MATQHLPAASIASVDLLQLVFDAIDWNYVGNVWTLDCKIMKATKQ
jgi:hypothetical protein